MLLMRIGWKACLGVNISLTYPVALCFCVPCSRPLFPDTSLPAMAMTTATVRTESFFSARMQRQVNMKRSQ